MKKTLLFAFVFQAIIFTAKAQTFGFSQAAKPYTELTGGTAIDISKYTDTLPIGFDVSIKGIKSSKLVLSHYWGYFYFQDFEDTRFTFFGTELTNGSFSYLLEGAAGNRIFKLQAKNVNFGHDFTVQDYINVQVWIYEADNTIEVRFGKSNVQNFDFDFYFGLGGPQIGFKNLKLSGGAGSPVLSPSDTARITGMPANGKAFTFKVQNLSAPEGETIPPLSIQPNPASNTFVVLGDVEQIVLHDMTGKQFPLTLTNFGSCSIADINAIRPGIYLVKATGGQGVLTQKLVIE